MKSLKTIMVILLCGSVLLACGGKGQNDPQEPAAGTVNLSSQEQAEIVAASLVADKGGIGADIENITEPDTARAAQRAAGFTLTVAATLDCYDSQGDLQEACNSETTDEISYAASITGKLSTNIGFFQEFTINNGANFNAANLLSGTALINGRQTNNSSYSRVQSLLNTRVDYHLACDLEAINLTESLNDNNAFPESGKVNGSIDGSWVRVTNFSRETKEIHFSFMVTYLPNNGAEIVLNDGTTFIVWLETGDVEEVVEE